jgi:hypothetical protein
MKALTWLWQKRHSLRCRHQGDGIRNLRLGPSFVDGVMPSMEKGVLGHETMGEVVAVGAKDKKLRPQGAPGRQDEGTVLRPSDFKRRRSG